MGVGVGRGLTWCMWRSQRLHGAKTAPLLARSLFSQTGVWTKDFTNKEREDVENHWMPIIKDNDKFHSENPDPSRPKYYVLSMFPYPSGRLHMGHVRVYTLSDTAARFRRLAGYSVIHPMGWDAFGLPAENAAILRGQKPQLWTYRNIESMRQQLNQMGFSFDWHREFATCDPSYYRWTQHLFLKMWDAGLVYQKEGEVNWDPVDMTVLANEQIDEQGRSWRSGVKVEKRYLKQWYIRTTSMAKSLYDGLSDVDADLWRDIIALQRHWVGTCNGTKLQFAVRSADGQEFEPMEVFTSTPEAVYGVAYLAISPQHRLNQTQLYEENSSADDKEILLSIQAVHPFTGDAVPIVVSSSTQFDRFNDVQLGIPSVDDGCQRLAERLQLPYRSVLDTQGDQTRITNSGHLNGLDRSQAFDKILEKARELGVGGHLVSQRLHDWLISRQRYWGTPIPMVHCHTCKAVPVPYDDLPVELPEVDNLTGRGSSPLATQQQWVHTSCPRCGGPAKRETDTMDTFVDSSWYFLRYLDPGNTAEPYSRQQADPLMPVDLYIGGKEHAVMHLYFARFFCHFLHSQGMLGRREPFVDLLTQGMVMGQSYRVKGGGKYLAPEEVDFSGPKPREKASGAAVVTQWEKMSKSKHNGVDPQAVVDEFGVDSTRLCILSSVSPQSNRKWSNEAFKGIVRWQARMWQLVGAYISDAAATKDGGGDEAEVAQWEQQLYDARNLAVKEVTFHCSKTYLLNTAVSHLQLFTKKLGKVPQGVAVSSELYGRCLADLCLMLAPMTPAFACELWTGLASVGRARLDAGYRWERTVLEQNWPAMDDDFQLPLILKVNHAEKSSINLKKADLDKLTADLAHDLVRADPSYQQLCQGHKFQSIDFLLYPSYHAVIDFVNDKTTS